jgi:hypothetical protein
MTQYDLFGDPVPEAKPTPPVIPKPEPVIVKTAPIEKPKPLPPSTRPIAKGKKEEEIEAALTYIKKAYHLWDMRCWTYRNYDAAIRFLQKYGDAKIPHVPQGLNEGHGSFMIGKLIDYHVPLEVIAEAMMENNNITFKKRIVQCWNNNDACPFWRKYKNFSDCNCERRCEKGEIIGDEQLNTML